MAIYISAASVALAVMMIATSAPAKTTALDEVREAVSSLKYDVPSDTKPLKQDGLSMMALGAGMAVKQFLDIVSMGQRIRANHVHPPRGAHARIGSKRNPR